MHRVRLIHWNADEAEERACRLQPAGFEVIYEPLDPTGLRRIGADPPSAVVIDLSQLPSQGRDIALSIRKHKATRYVPLVFVGGDPAKVARIKELLPDATFTNWAQIRRDLSQAIANPLADPIVPESTMAGYSGTPLPKKLGIKANSVVLLADAPPGVEDTLGELPEGVVLRREIGHPCNLTVWFCRSRKDLEEGIKAMTAFAPKGGLWIMWPKKASGVASDLSQIAVRQAGLASGLVDFKVAAIDATWSGLRFTIKRHS